MTENLRIKEKLNKREPQRNCVGQTNDYTKLTISFRGNYKILGID